MANVTKVTRVSNPRTASRARASRAKGRRKNPSTSAHRRRRMTPKQIRYFGTPRQKAALKAARSSRSSRSNRSNRTTRPKRSTAKRTSNPKRSSAASRTSKVRRRRRTAANPALVMTLGALNPHTTKKRSTKNKMAKARRSRKATTSHRRRTRRSNPYRAATHHTRRHRRRRSNPHRAVARYSRRRRRNPGGFDSVRSTGSMVLGILLGVTAAKIIPGLLPASLVGASPIMRIIVTGVSAYLAAMLAKKFSPSIGQGVMYGGMAQTASVGLNAFLPSIGSQIGLSGLSAFAPASFTVPQNPITAGAAQNRLAIAAASATKGGMGGRGFARAFGAA